MPLKSFKRTITLPPAGKNAAFSFKRLGAVLGTVKVEPCAMAQRATGMVKRSVIARTNRSDSSTRAFAEARAAARAIPLMLAPLLTPYKKHGRLSLRIERLPHLALLSAGRNNGDNSWSLALDELEDLAYLLPEGMDEPHTLAIRIIGLDDGSTLAVLDFPVAPGALGFGTGEGELETQDATVEPGDNALRLLRDELAKLRATLADRESELAKARQDAEQAETEFSRQKTEAELALGRAARKAELDEGKFASLTADLLMRKGEAKSSMLTPPAEFSKAEPDERKFAGLTHGLIVRKGEARPSMIAPPPAESSVSPMSDGRDAPSQHEAKEALLKAETAWKAGEAARLTAAEAQWQEKLTRAVKEARTQAEAARDQGIELELNRLREDCAALEARLADRETALVQAGLAIEQAREGSQHEAKEALSKAETGWKADEAARLAAAEAQWQEKLASAVKEARAQGEAARDRGIELELNRLREECTGLRGTLADRETALVQAGLAIEQAREGSQHEAKEALSKAEMAWKADEAARLAAAEAQWREQSARVLAEVTERCERAETSFAEVSAKADAVATRDQHNEIELRRLREECTGLRGTLADRETAMVQAGLAIAQAREGSQHEAKEALSKAETAWKADEAARLAAAEAQWQEKLASAVKEARAQAEAARDRGIELELNRLREECTGLWGTLADRETALVQAGLAIEQARERWQREAQEALSKAETGWKAGEAARLAAAEAQWHAAQTQWREQSASALAEVTERCERAETSFAEVSAKADAVATRDQHNEIELRRLREVCAALRAILADRETALAEAGLAIEQAREQWQREAHEALSKAETGWKAGEAARLAAAQTQWQEQSASALAEVTARCQRAETSLAEVSAKADAVAARDPDNEIELRRMREECTGLRAILADREAALAQGGLAIEQARERWQRETQEALSKAETGWKAEEAARLATAEAQWRKQSASALAEMTVRCKRAETSLVEANARADSIVKRDQSNKAEFRRLREELAKTQAALADREVELACARSATDQSRESQTPGTDIVLKPNRIGSIRAIEHREKKASRHLVRDMAVAASLAIATVVLYPYIEPSFPEIGTSSSGPAPAGSSASSAQSPQRAGQRMAVVIHAGNVRAGPSTGAAIVSTLQRGLKVATVEQRGNWTLVRIEDETGDTKPQQGWVYSSFLDAGGSDQESPTAKRK